MMKPGWKGIYLYKFGAKRTLFDQATQQIAVKLMTCCNAFLPETVLTSDVHVQLFDQ